MNNYSVSPREHPAVKSVSPGERMKKQVTTSKNTTSQVGDEDLEQDIREQTPHRAYFHIVINWADDVMDPYQYRLYGHYQRWTKTKEGTRKTAEKCQMSVGMVVRTRQWLADNGWITVTHQGKGKPVIVEIADRWADNMSRYGKDKTPKTPKTRVRDPLFDLIASRQFGITDTSDIGSSGGRIAKVKAVVVRHQGTVEDVNRFYTWYATTYPQANLPKDAGKFEEHWLAFRQAKTVMPASASQRVMVGLPPIDPREQAEAAALFAKLQGKGDGNG